MLDDSCWACGAAPALQVCSQCREDACEPCGFCSRACFEADWPRHNAWHKEQRRLFALAEVAATKHWTVAALVAESPYDELLSAMTGLGTGAAPAPPASPAPAPSSPTAGSDLEHACRTFVQCVERADEGAGLAWADRAVSAYALLSCTPTLPRPAWWTDAGLSALSERVLAARPDSTLAWRFRGEVLGACLGENSWSAAPRSAVQLVEASQCLQRAAKLGELELMLQADRERVVGQAVACMRAAQALGPDAG